MKKRKNYKWKAINEYNKKLYIAYQKVFDNNKIICNAFTPQPYISI